MSSNETNGFMAFLKHYSVPVAAIIYILAFVVQLKEYSDKLGWRVLSIVVLLMSVIWTFYVWTAKRLTLIEPASLIPRFGKRARLASVLSLPLACVPVWYSLQAPPPFSMPPLAIKVINQKDQNVSIRRTGEFFITAPASPMMDTVVGSGKVRLYQIGEASPSDQNLVVPANNELMVFAEFLNPAKFKHMLSAGDLSFRIVILQSDGKMLTREGIPFEATQLNTGYIELNTR